MPGEACEGCSYLVGHAQWCARKPKPDRELGWNEAIEEVARFVRRAHGRDLWQPLGSQIDGLAADILTLKK
jgi:hypothetical protein